MKNTPLPSPKQIKNVHKSAVTVREIPALSNLLTTGTDIRDRKQAIINGSIYGKRNLRRNQKNNDKDRAKAKYNRYFFKNLSDKNSKQSLPFYI